MSAHRAGPRARTRRLTAAVGIVAVSSLLVADATQVAAPAAVAKDVRTVWEQAIAAKGGRSRLHAIRSFVVTSEKRFSNSPRPEVATREYVERLTVLPNRFWEFDDYRPGLMGTHGLMLDLQRRQVWDRNGRPAPLMLEDLTHRFYESQFIYLLETASLVPKLVRLTTGTVDGAAVDVVETQTAGDRVDFFFAQDTHLPVRVSAYRKQFTPPDPSARRDYRTTDYMTQDGIQMPRRVYFSRDSDVTLSDRFNVDYDPAVFDPKTLRFEVRGWMPR